MNNEELSPLEQTLSDIITKTKCPVCRKGSIQRRPGGRVMMDGLHIEWRCMNQDCLESSHWNIAGEHRKWEGGVR
jgi:hypothetical protein